MVDIIEELKHRQLEIMNDLSEEKNLMDEIARRNGFDYAKYLGVYKKENIYKPSFYDTDSPCIGRPRYLHVKNGKARWSKSYAEAFKVVDYFFSEE